MSKKDSLKRHKADRDQIVSQLEGFYDFIKKCDPLTNNFQISERLAKCEELWDGFNRVTAELQYLDEPCSQNVKNEFEEKYFETICMFKERLHSFVYKGDSSQFNSAVSNPVKLPPLDLPCFDGKYDKWTSFFDTFIALIHSNCTLSNVQKFYYLQSSLKGEAAQVIASIQVTDLNYETAFKLLRERYENRRLIIQSHLRSLFEIPSVSRNNHIELRKCLDTIQKNVRALQTLNEPIEHWDTILIYMLSQKLDISSKSEWEAFVVKNQTANFKEFVNFLTERCQVLESVQAGKFQDRVADNKPKGKFSFVLNQGKCLVCNNGDHWFSNCTKFINMSESSRIREIKRLRLCLNCLKPNHLSSRCNFSGCKKCGKPHHYLLHIDYSKMNKKQDDSVAENLSQEKQPAENQVSVNTSIVQGENKICKIENMSCEHTSVTAHSSKQGDREVLLSTAKVLVSDKNGKMHEARALLDCGSQSNFVSSDFVSRLNLNTNNVNVSIVSVNSYVTKSSKSVTINIKSKFSSFSKKLDFIVLNKITSQLPSSTINKENLNIPVNLFLADPTFNISGPIDLLLGASMFYDLLLVGQIKLSENMPVLQKTQLGWIISGNVPLQRQGDPHEDDSNASTHTVCNFSSNLDIQSDLEKFWKVDEVPSVRIMKKEERECEDLFVRTTTRDINGKFVVELPTKEGFEEIGNSKEMALKRFNKLERKLESNESIKLPYINFMREYETLGHMTLIPKNEVDTNNPVYYLPHHPVLKETSLTTKLRVVFDASAKTNKGISLNDKLKSGPVIQDELYSILVRFREHNCVIGADIEKMYRQVWIKEDHRDLQRIIWRESSNEELKYYRLNTVTYGTVPSSFLAIRSLFLAAESEEINFPEASKHIKRNFYVDDLLTGAATVEEAVKLKQEISGVLQKFGFILRKWVSNKSEILDSAENKSEVTHYIIEEKVTKTLGIAWNIQEDSLQYTVKLNENLRSTKRNILSVISKVFDPLGLIGPVIIIAKIIIQKLWLEKLDWDDEVSNELSETWMKFYVDLPILNDLYIARHAVCEDPKVIELHGFCDASEKAYGACIYFRSMDFIGKIKIQLLCAKSKVAPMKTLSLPRLELCGALLLSRLMTKTVESLSLRVTKFYYWTDSKIVLSWLSAEAANWNTFVSHRVAEIQLKSDVHNWQHVAGEDNPADLISRGCRPEKLVSSTVWWQGPLWLAKSKEEWPSYDSTEVTSLEVPEKRIVKQIFLFFQMLDQSLFERYSTLLKLQRVVAYCLRFYKNVTSHVNNKLTGNLSVLELEQSLFCLIKLAQNAMFYNEINQLMSNKPISSKSKLLPLNPFLDNDVLRVGGRLANASVAFDYKHPVILDKNHIFSKLIISHEHKKNLHMGPQNLLSNIRAKYWILGGLNTVKGVLRSCIVCFKVKPKGYNTIMGQLPRPRLMPTRPFFNTGVDFAGPFNIKSSSLRNAKLQKAYLCLFICFVTKATHLEVVSDLTTSAFLNALKRFISRRGKCQNIYSDCGTNFVGANREMSEFFKFIKGDGCQNEICKYLSQDGIKWNFIPPRSPHFGGLWESHVKLAKYYVKRILGNAVLTFEELTTVFTQIEACLNSRPLSPLSNDVNDLTPLTPGHFLIGDSLVALPEQNVSDIKCSRLNRYQYLKQLVQHFWDRWYREYLCDLNKRSKWINQNSNVVIGDMVLLRDENLPPLKWPLGRVESIFPGSDGIVRVVLVKTANGSFKRAVSKICILPLNDTI